MAPVHRTVTEEEVLPELAWSGVDAVVLVEADDHRGDTDVMLETAARHPDFLLRPEVATSLDLVAAAGLSFDLVSALPRHLELVPRLCEAHPELRLVIDHLSRPPIGAATVEPWWTLFARAAESPQVSAKVSGLYPDADRSAWSTELVRPFVEHAFAVFGASRLMYGGDWPISVLAGGYSSVWQGLMPLFASLSEAERSDVLGGTARRCYRLDERRLAAAAALKRPLPTAGS